MLFILVDAVRETAKHVIQVFGNQNLPYWLEVSIYIYFTVGSNVFLQRNVNFPAFCLFVHEISMFLFACG